MNIQEYSVALATSLESNKNPSAVAREVGTSQSTSSRFLKKLDLTDRDFVPFVHHIFGNKKLNLVIDDGVISKRYSEEIEGVSSMVDQSTKTFTNGYKIVVAGLTDGKYFLPIAIEQWIAEFIMRRLSEDNSISRKINFKDLRAWHFNRIFCNGWSLFFHRIHKVFG